MYLTQASSIGVEIVLYVCSVFFANSMSIEFRTEQSTQQRRSKRLETNRLHEEKAEIHLHVVSYHSVPNKSTIMPVWVPELEM